MIDIETEAQFIAADELALRNGRPRNLGAISNGALAACVDAGRWIVHCPCGSARMAAPGVLFWCPDCGNAFARGAQVPVMFPPDELIEQITAALASWPKVHRGWNQGETVRDLEAQTAEHFGAYAPDTTTPEVRGAPRVMAPIEDQAAI